MADMTEAERVAEFVNAVLADNKQLREDIGKTAEQIAATESRLAARIFEAQEEANRLRFTVAALMENMGVTRVEIPADVAPLPFGYVTVRLEDYARKAVVTFDKPTQPGSRRVDMTLVDIV